MTTAPDDRGKQTAGADMSEEIGRTTRRYLASRWQGIALVMVPTVVVICLVAWSYALVLGMLPEGILARGPWGPTIVSAGYLGCLALVALLARKLGAFRRLAAWRDREAGVVVGWNGRASPRAGAVIGGLFGALIPSLFILTIYLAARSPVRLQPLEGALCLALLSISGRTIGAWLSRDPEWYPLADPRPFAGTLLFLVYGVAVAAGAPQPWSTFPPAGSHLPSWLGAAIHVMPSALIATGIDVAGRHLHSRLQFRRLQRLVNESAPPEGDHGAD